MKKRMRILRLLRLITAVSLLLSSEGCLGIMVSAASLGRHDVKYGSSIKMGGVKVGGEGEVSVQASESTSGQTDKDTSAGSSIADSAEMPGAVRTGDIALMKPADPMLYLSASDAKHLNEQMAGYAGAEETTLLINNAKTFYYYEQLDPIEREIYDVAYEVAKDPVSEGNIGFMMTDMDPSEEEFNVKFSVAIHAMCFDHPELFWLYSGKKANIVYSSEAVNVGGFYYVYIHMYKPYEDYVKEMTAFNMAAQQFLSQINTGVSEYETVRQVHYKLISLVNYNDLVMNQINFSILGIDYAHTAYGCLVSDSSGNPNYAVCDGYTLAFEYLLQQCGIESVFIGGDAGNNESDVGGHAWSLVKIDGNWYEVDATWDDSESMLDDFAVGSEEYNYTLEYLNDFVFREKLDHAMFLVSTEHLRHFDPGEEYQYITQDQQYLINPINPSVHIRMGVPGTEEYLDSQIIRFAPIAEHDYQD